MGSKLNRLPVTFSKSGEIANKDTRFINVVIDVLHTGENLNGSIFDKESVNKAADTIKNRPILGYIEKTQAGDIDFKGHEHELVVDDDGIKYVYAGSAYGVIPESCNPRWVVRDDGNGVQREYFRVDGLLWTKFDDSCDIFERDIKKNQSMEICNIDGYVDKNGYFVVKSFDFDGCCILSTTNPKIQPAMTGSEIVADFTVDTIASQIKQKLDEYAALKDCSQSSKEAEIDFTKGEDNLEKKLEILSKYGIEKSSLDFSLEEVSIEDLEKKCKEMTSEKEGTPAGDVHEEVEDDPKENFSLTMNDLMRELNEAISAEKYTDHWGDECSKYWMQDVQDDRTIVLDTQDYKLYAFPYKMNGDNVVIDFACKKRVKTKYEDWDDGETEPILGIKPVFDAYATKIDALKESEKQIQEKYEAIKSEFDDMKPKYDAYVEAEKAAKKAAEDLKREELFEVMDKQLNGVEEYETLKKNKDMEFSVLEDECYKLLGRKAIEFSYAPSAGKDPKQNNLTRFGVSGIQVKNEEKYGDLFERYHVR